MASQVAQPTAGAVKSLGSLRLNGNQITDGDAGCATLASALRGAALPALKTLYLHNNPASQEARDVVQSALNSAEESDDERGEVSV